MLSPDAFYRLLQNDRVPALILLYGAEPFLLQQAVQAVRRAVLPDGRDDFNDHRFNGKETTAAQLLEAVRTLPVFAARKLVTLKDAQQFSVAEMENFSAYLEDPVAETCLLFVADKIDARRRFFQLLKKHAAVVEFKPLTEKSLPPYVRRNLDARDISISGDALTLFCSMVGTGLHEVHAELDKLCNYIGQGSLIDVKDVQAVVSRGRAENIFELGRAVGRGDSGRALSLSRRLLAAGEPPLRILALLVRHFRQLWKVRELQVKNCPNKDIARLAGVPAFAVTGLVEQGRRFSRRDFSRAFELFLETDLAMKSSGANAEALLDQLLLQLSSGKGARQKS